MAKKAAEEAAKAEKVAKKAEEERMRAERKEEIEREKVAKKEAKEKAKAEAEREREEEDKKKIQVRFPPPTKLCDSPSPSASSDPPPSNPGTGHVETSQYVHELLQEGGHAASDEEARRPDHHPKFVLSSPSPVKPGTGGKTDCFFSVYACSAESVFERTFLPFEDKKGTVRAPVNKFLQQKKMEEEADIETISGDDPLKGKPIEEASGSGSFPLTRPLRLPRADLP